MNWCSTVVKRAGAASFSSRRNHRQKSRRALQRLSERIKRKGTFFPLQNLIDIGGNQAGPCGKDFCE